MIPSTVVGGTENNFIIDQFYHSAKSCLAANTKVLEPKAFKALGAQRIKVRYGPFLVPSVRDEVTHGMKNFTINDETVIPCKDCFITSFLPDLEFGNGEIANANNGMWLHHAAWLNRARNDTVCSRFPERWIASGNERTLVDFTNAGYVFPQKVKAGYCLARC
jgi:hypothetical protein